MRRKILFLLFLLTIPSPVLAHWEDPQGCGDTLAKIRELSPEWQRAYQGISEDGRDYVIRFIHVPSALTVEEHYDLLPQSQWESADQPKYVDHPLSEWMDWDSDGHYGEWYLFPRGRSNCDDALHFIWDKDLQTYKLYATGKERT